MSEWDGSSTETYLIGGAYDSAVEALVLTQLRQQDASTETALIHRPTASDSGNLPHRFARQIADLPNEPYVLTSPIPIIVEELGPGEYVASFREANIAISGESIEEAQMNLTAHILDVYEALRDENLELLGREVQRQLAVLRQYLREP